MSFCSILKLNFWFYCSCKWRPTVTLQLLYLSLQRQTIFVILCWFLHDVTATLLRNTLMLLGLWVSYWLSKMEDDSFAFLSTFQTQSPTRIVPFYMLPLLLIFSQFTILYLYCLHYVIVAHCWAMVYAVAYCSFPIQLFLFPGVDSCFNFYNFSRLNFLCLCQYFFFSHILTKDGMSSITPDKYSS